jgi:DNA-binding LytR/AlgR family response regulator
MKTAPTAVIAEDEPVLRGELRETLAQLWPELAILAEAEDGLRRCARCRTCGRTCCFSTSKCRV